MVEVLFKILRKLPYFKGKKRLFSLLVGDRKRYKDIWIFGKNQNKYILPGIQDAVGWDIFVNGNYESELISFINKQIPLNGVFLDIGANIGALAIPLKKLRPDISIYCFEASPRVFNYLQKNVSLNQVDISLINLAVTNQDGTVLDFFSSEEKFGTGSLSPIFTKNAEKVISTRLDSFCAKEQLKKIDYIKVDVEGFECGVFKGMGTLLNQHVPIIFEFCDWAEELSGIYQKGDAQEFLLQAGYQLYELENEELRPIHQKITTGFKTLLAKSIFK